LSGIALARRNSQAVAVFDPDTADTNFSGSMPPVARPMRCDSDTKSCSPVPVSSNARLNRRTYGSKSAGQQMQVEAEVEIRLMPA